MHKSSVAALNGFIYTRLFLQFMGPLIVKKFGDQPRKPEVYNFAIFTAAAIAVAEVDLPHAPKIYATLVVLIVGLNCWVSAEVERERYVNKTTS